MKRNGKTLKQKLGLGVAELGPEHPAMVAHATHAKKMDRENEIAQLTRTIQTSADPKERAKAKARLAKLQKEG